MSVMPFPVGIVLGPYVSDMAGQGDTWKHGQDGRHYADDSFKCIFLKENLQISKKISLKCVP